MKRPILIVAIAVLALWAGPAAALTSSGEYRFKPDVSLELAVQVQEGLSVDSIRFYSGVPGPVGMLRGEDVLKAEVTISNLSREARRIGVAVALFDEDGRLLGVASGGNRFRPQRDERQRTYTLVFEHVNRLVETATTFKITVETR